MSGTLTTYLDAVRRELRRAAVARGVAWMLLALVAGLSLAGGIDYFVRGEGTTFRIALSLLAFLPGLIVGGLFVVWPMASQMSRLQVAQRVERADPRWRGGLASATAFLEPRPEYGSQALQRHTLDVVETRIVAEGGSRPVAWRPVRHAVGYAGFALLMAAAVFVISPRPSRVAVARLAQPFAAIEWPRRVDLVILDESGRPLPDPVNIGEGETFRFFVANARGALPRDLMLQTRGPSGETRDEPLPTVEEAPPEIGRGRVGVAALYAGAGPIRFRVTGGDDRRMPFRTANVVIPPRLEEIRVTVRPPAYLNAEPTSAPPGVTRVRGLLGSMVTIRARTNKPLAAAELFIGDQPAPRPEIRKGGREILATFRLANERPSSYWFRLRDTTGFENPHAPRYEISTRLDAPPEVVLTEPAADLTATPTATLAISVKASDDHGLTAMRLRYGPPQKNGPGRLPDAQSSELDTLSQIIPLLEDSHRPREAARQFDWPLAPLGLTAGDQLAFRGEATDAFDLGPPRIGMSSPRTVTILTPRAKRQELLDRQAALLSELSEAHRATFHLLQAIDSLGNDLKISGELLATHRDQLSRAELEQQHLREHLVGDSPSSEAAARGMLMELSANQIEDAALRDRLEDIADELRAQHENALASATQNLTAARKAADVEKAADALAAARGDLAIVEEGLESLLDELGAWRNRRDFLAEISDLLGLQHSLAEEAAGVASETLGTAADELTPDQTNRLDSLGSRQSSVAERLDRLTAQLQTPGEAETTEASSSEPAAQERLAKKEDSAGETAKKPDPKLRAAAEQLQSSGLATTARAAGDSIRANRLGEAGRLQTEILSELEELRETLSEQEPVRGDAEELRQLEKTLGELSDEQESVLETLRKRDEHNPSQRRELEARQRDLRTRTAAASRDARRMDATEASDALTQAVAAMTEGLERLRRRGDAETALAEALRKLREGQTRVSEESAERGGGLAEPIPESMAAQVRALGQRQTALNAEVVRLEDLQSKHGTLSRAQLLTLRKTQGVQSTLASETADLRSTLAEAKVIQFVFDLAIARMEQVAGRLDDRDVGPETQHAGAAAAARLHEIGEAIATAGRRGSNPNERTASEETEGSGDAAPRLAQLKLLLALQLDLQRRTKSLESRKDDEATQAAAAREIEALGRELEQLRQLVSSLVFKQSMAEDPEG